MSSTEEPPKLFDAQGIPLTRKSTPPASTSKWTSNQIVIGMVGVLFATAVGVPYYIAQQRYQAHQADIASTINQAVLVEDDVVRMVRRVMTADNIFVGAFRDQTGYSLGERRKEAIDKQREWDNSVPTIDLRLKRFFSSRAVEAWHQVIASKRELDADAKQIEYETNLAARQRLFEKFEDDYAKVEARLNALTEMMQVTISDLRKSLP